MIFTLQRRFLLLLVVPVTLILVGVGFAGFYFARLHLLDQWATSTQLLLDKAAHEISMQLDSKLHLINLIGKAQSIPDADITQAFLIQQLAELQGVRFVDVEPFQPVEGKGSAQGSHLHHFSIDNAEGLYTMELCDDIGFCAPTVDPNAVDRSLRIMKIFKDSDGTPTKRLVVRISFDSFLEPIKQMSVWKGTTACLVTSTGQILSCTDKTFADRKRLGDNGSQLERQVLEEIRHKAFGTVWGQGHPPDFIVGFYKLPRINWYVLLISKGSAVLEPIVHFRQYYMIAGIIALIVILLLIRLTTRSVARSIGEISTAASAVQAGDYGVELPEDRSDEIGQLSRSFNKMVEGLKQRDLIEQTFGRYVDKNVAAELMSRPEALRLGGEKRTVTIMMSDLRDFTGISEKLPPERVIKMLNRYFSRMIAVIEKYKGIIVDFYGDSILVFFDGVDTDIRRRAEDAVHCGLEMQRRLEGFAQENVERGLPILTMGVGIHTGDVIVGNIGTETRAKYGIVGADVNLTDRIQYAAGAGKVVISEQTYQLISDKLNVANKFRVCLKGVEGQKKLYEIESVQESSDSNSSSKD